jgi:hypothetical protein
MQGGILVEGVFGERGALEKGVGVPSSIISV